MSETEPTHETTDPRIIERIAWLTTCLGLVVVPFAGILLAAPWYWYAYATLYLMVIVAMVRRA